MDKKTLLISVVSHGQGHLIKKLFECLNKLNFPDFLNVHLHLVLNIPEDEDFIDDLNLDLVVYRNSFKKGFGANNNQAFKSMKSDYFLVINPDIQIIDFDFKKFILYFEQSNASVMSPLVRNSSGILEDNFRPFPTISNIIKRRLGKKHITLLPNEHLHQADWIAGMFMLFKSADFNCVGGFDEKFFMYLEDADICRRLSYKNKYTYICRDFEVMHDAQRQSRKNIRFFLWHISSLFKFLVSE